MMPDPDPMSDVPGMALWGWMTPDELQWLSDQASRMRGVVEVGSLHGRSSYALAIHCPGDVYCIDPWPDGAWESWEQSVGNVLPNAHGIRGFSPESGVNVPDPVDMVFLDGAHDRTSVINDIEYWRPRTQVLLCGHDYLHAGYPDVALVVDELLGEDATLVPGTSIWACWSHNLHMG
jgi:phage baseplate assembly protein W